MPCPQGEPPGKGTSFFLSHDQSHSQINEVSWKDVTNALSLANMVLGLFSIIFSFSRKRHYASWMLLVSFLLDMAVRAMTSHINICSKWGVDGLLSGILAIIYVSAASFHLCFYSPGVPSTYKGLPCPYASCILASTSLLTKGNRFILCCMASLMILFMMDQSYYPYDKILESENWKKLVYMGDVRLQKYLCTSEKLGMDHIRMKEFWAGDICYNSPERRSWEYRLQQAVVMERRWQETSSVYVFEHHLPETGTQASLHRQRPKLDSKEFLGSCCW
ncbi:transmembrane protein 269 isoform X3 [Papio anubis]|uniref:transmembrane protein 269 isoform X3 n=1 Tax=Papio anubis TaxID=9555 RepID=UPI0004F1EBEA|nr:transmembrane protein 269 isoform X3 [Papio anubis]